MDAAFKKLDDFTRNPRLNLLIVLLATGADALGVAAFLGVGPLTAIPYLPIILLMLTFTVFGVVGLSAGTQNQPGMGR